jgi:hypothetical protein
MDRVKTLIENESENGSTKKIQILLKRKSNTLWE